MPAPKLDPAKVRYDLDTLYAELGDPAASIDDVVGDTPRGVFVALGERIATRPILLDAPRIVGTAHAFIAGHPDHGVDVTTDLLALTVQQARTLADVYASHASATGADSAAHKSATDALAAAMDSGTTLQGRSETQLTSIAARDPALRKQVADATTAIESSDDLAKNLENLAALYRGFLKHKHDPIAARVKLFGATAARATALEGQAIAIRDAAIAASGKSVSKVGQADVDYQDGIVLHLLGELIHAFEAAHASDRAVPLLVPISTRRVLGKRGHKKAGAAAVPGAPAKT